MSLRIWVVSCILLVLLVALAHSQNTSTAPTQAAGFALGPAGTVWGGQHLKLEVTAEGVNLDFDCATGTIAKAVTVDALGKFQVNGALTREHGGPVMRDGNPSAPATYSGAIQGDTLHLVVTSGPSQEPYGEYVLVRGKPGRVLKCK
ncbi:MAG TPA: hypothetical protein VMU45_10980 [Candidatus Eisenbacteria bacterium]|nr:hypothetical protein [Candidatus Eisenbacteria bacterium]